MPRAVKWHQQLHDDSSSATASECTWDAVSRLIRGLNGRDRTDVFLGELGADRLLSVAGGNSDRYVVVVQEPGRYFYLARKPAPTEQEKLVEVVVGGLSAYFPYVLVHPLNIALSAAEHYFRTGRRARILSWMRGDAAQRLRRRAEQDAL